MAKTDLSKLYPSYYKAGVNPTQVTFKPAHFISIEGKGDPSSQAFLDKIQALYPVAYAIKFHCKSEGNDFVVPKLEALWWYDEEKYQSVTMEDAPKLIPRSEWQYRLLIRMPDFVTKKMVVKCIDEAASKKQSSLIREVVYFTLDEKDTVQILHVGPYNTEPESLKKLKKFIDDRKLGRNGPHHEIYLSDFRKTPPEKLKTILREPVVSD